MIIRPKEFNEALPAQHDGVFHWEYVDERTRSYGGITGADVDYAIDRKGQAFLHIETSDAEDKFADLRNGQNKRTLAYLRTGLVAHIDIVGKRIPTQWRWLRFDASRGLCVGDWQHSADGRSEIGDRIDKWLEWADRLPDWHWRMRLFDAAICGAPRWLLERLRDKINSALNR